MGLFNLFKKPTTIQDDFFGPLRLISFKDNSKNYFEGKRFFTATNGDTEVLIDADNEGPTEQKNKFYNDLQNNFDQYTHKIKPLIEDEFRNWKEDFQIKDFNKEFKLVCLNIPRLDQTPLKWEMSFTTIHDANHHITVSFENDQPVAVLIDG
jgi:hypothetical protein